MLRLSIKALESFKRVYRDEKDIELSDDKANQLGVELLLFFKLIYKPISKSDAKNIPSQLDFPKGFCSLGSKENK